MKCDEIEQPTKICKGGVYFKKRCIYIENNEVPGCKVCVGKSIVNMGGEDVLICEIDKYNKALELKKKRNDGIKKYWEKKQKVGIMNLITEKEYRNVIKSHTELVKLIVLKTTQLSMLLYNRLPIGIYRDYDFEEIYGKICVQFESYSCGEPNFDTFNLPLEFLFDESYPEKYKLIWEEEKHKEKEEKKRKYREEEDNRKESCKIYEIKEYERLKLKYEKTNINLVDVDKIWDKDDDKL